MLELSQIYSATACLETAKGLRALAAQYERRAKDLQDRRNLAEIGNHDMPAMARAVLWLKKKDNFPNVSASECRDVARRFLIEWESFERISRNVISSHKRHIARQKAKAARAMASQSVKQTEIARRLDLSPSRVNDILNPCPISQKAKRAGLSKGTYLKMKAAGKLRADLL